MGSRGFIPHRRGNPCPLCGRDDGTCRTTVDLNVVLCRTYADGDSPNPGYTFKKPAQNSFWGVHAPATGVQRTWQETQQIVAQISHQQEAQRQHIRSGLPLAARDREFKKLLWQLPLSDQHRADLLQRGFTSEEIARSGYRTVAPWQRVSGVSPKLPGMDGDRLRTYCNWGGLLCPIRDRHGRFIGAQIRHDNEVRQRTGDKTKYTFLSATYPSHLPNNEWPLQILPGSGPIRLAEGTLKPEIACSIHGGTWIGAVGGLFTKSPNQLREALAALCPADTPIEIWPDKNSVANDHVYRTILSAIALLKTWGYSVRLADWGQLHAKDGQHDCDEIPANTQINWLSAEGFERLRPELNPQLPDLDRLKQQQAWIERAQQLSWPRWERDKEFTPTHTIDAPHFNFDRNLLSDRAIVGIKSGLGTGKTHWMGQAIQMSDKGFLGIGHRNCLLLQTGSRWPNFHHLMSLTDLRARSLLCQSPTAKLLLCIDSILKIDLEAAKGKNIILDEAMAVLTHAHLSGTAIAQYRLAALQHLSEILQNAGQIFLLDGNLSDRGFAYLHQLAGLDRPAYKIFNRYQIPYRPIQFLDGSDKDCRSTLTELVLQAERPVLATDSREYSKAIAKLLTEQGRQGLLVNSETVGTPEVRAFLADPVAWIWGNEPEYLIYSPSAQDGLDISLAGYFTGFFAAFTGVLGTDAQVQMLFRLRDPQVPRIVACVEQSKLPDTIPLGFFADAILNNHQDWLRADLEASLEGLDQTELPIAAIQERLQADRHRRYWAHLLNTRKHEKKHLRECLQLQLQASGHQLELVPCQAIASAWDAEREAREKNKTRWAQDVFDAEDITPSEIETFSLQGTYAAQCAVRKCLLRVRLPGISQSPLWSPDLIRELLADRPELIRQAERLWLLHHPDIAKNIQVRRWLRLAEGHRSVSDHKSDLLLVRSLLKLDFLALLYADEPYNKHSPKLLQLLETCRQPEFKTAFQAVPTEKTEPIKWFGKLLGFVGAKNAEQKQVTIDGRRVRPHQVDRSEIEGEVFQLLLACLTRRHDRVAENCTEGPGNSIELTGGSVQPDPRWSSLSNLVDLHSLYAAALDLDPEGQAEALQWLETSLPPPVVPLARNFVRVWLPRAAGFP